VKERSSFSNASREKASARFSQVHICKVRESTWKTNSLRQDQLVMLDADNVSFSACAELKVTGMLWPMEFGLSEAEML